ncbi:MAG: hypothetical protein ABR559_00045 [Gemmatimonadota bacterium]
MGFRAGVRTGSRPVGRAAFRGALFPRAAFFAGALRRRDFPAAFFAVAVTGRRGPAEAGFLAAAFLAAAFLPGAFLALVFFAPVFFDPVFLAPVFFDAVFFAPAGFAPAFFRGAFRLDFGGTARFFFLVATPGSDRSGEG